MDYETYLSPFTWRYGSPAMRSIWSEANKRRLWRQLWVILAEVQAEYGLVTSEQLSELRSHTDDVDVPRALEIEAEIHHDLMAEIKAFAEQAPHGGKILHMGATSTDIEDNADVLRIRSSMDLLIESLRGLCLLFCEKIELWAETPLIAITHLQPAEPSSLGYRMAMYAQDLFLDWEELSRLRANLRAKGFRGAVGTGASYAELLDEGNLHSFEQRLSERLKIAFFPITTQVYPRKQDYIVISALAGLGSSLYKLAFDLRILQSPSIGELSEPFGDKQVGSSSMPFKRNPVNAEKIDSLGRYLAQMPRLAWDNAAHSLLERTLDDSANRRILLPETFLIVDELLHVSTRILDGLHADPAAMARNLAIYAPFAAIERTLMALGKAGADRQEMHERLRKHALRAWEAIRTGEENPLPGLILNDKDFQRYLTRDEIVSQMDVSRHLGDAPQRARSLATQIRTTLENSHA